MDGPFVIGPGLGREKFKFQSGKYPISRIMFVLEGLAKDADRCFIKVSFKNGSSQLLEKVSDLAAIPDFRKVRSVFLHVVYSDGSTVSGRPINSPFGGFLFFDEAPSGDKSARSDARRKRSNDGPQPTPLDPAATISCQRGHLFKHQWEPVESKFGPSLKRAVKYISAVAVAGVTLWTFGTMAFVLLATSLGIEIPQPDQQQARPSKTDFSPLGLAVSVGMLLFIFSFAWHMIRMEKFLATRAFHPLVGPALAKLRAGIQRSLASTRPHVVKTLLPFLLALAAGLIVLYTEKVLWK